MESAKKTHRDYQDIIGETAATSKNYLEKRWNQYYFKTLTHTVGRMIDDRQCKGGTVLDLGTSHGNWFVFLKKRGFDKILGVELDAHRAELARSCGYNEVYNCDASKIPHPDSSIDVAISNDVFVHILQLGDKIAVLKEVQRLLKPGGVFIFNHTIARAFNYQNYHVDQHCSFLSLDELIRLITDNTAFKITSIKPTYYTFRNQKITGIRKIVRHLMILLPLGVSLRYYRDYFNTRNLPLEQSDNIYLELRKL